MIKLLLTGLIALAVAFSVTFYYNSQNVTKQEFRIAHQLLNKRIDTLSYKLDSVQLSLDSLNSGQKTLKSGQRVLLKEITKQTVKQTESSFASELLNFLN